MPGSVIVLKLDLLALDFVDFGGHDEMKLDLWEVVFYHNKQMQLTKKSIQVNLCLTYLIQE